MNQVRNRVITTDLLPILDAAFDGIAIVEPTHCRIAYLNATLRMWLRQPDEAYADRPFEELVHPPYRDKLRESLDQATKGVTVDLSLQLDVPKAAVLSARCCRLEISGSTFIGILLGNSGSPQAVNAVMRRDPLTQLPDRSFLLSRLSTLIEGERAEDRRFAVLFVDLNNFKRINDEYGHLLGDRVLREVARRLSTCVREGDHVTRFGGDEFVILLERVDGPGAVDPVVNRIHDSLSRPIVLPEAQFDLSLSIGVARAAAHHRTATDVLNDADREMYAAKRAAH
jgi:diguanylate cyclase (GGDEF)-like protein